MAIYQGNKKLAYSCNVDNSVYAVPIGTILSYASATPPNGFLVCDGSEVLKTDYAELFEIIGDTYGKVYLIFLSYLDSLRKHYQPQEMEFSLGLCLLRLACYFRERVVYLKR